MPFGKFTNEFPEHTVSSDLKTWVMVWSLKRFAMKVTNLNFRWLLMFIAAISVSRDYQGNFVVHVRSIKVYFWLQTQYEVYMAI